MAIAISTAWNAFRHTNGKKIVLEIKKLGFSEIELSFNLTSNIVKDIEKLVASGQIKVRSLHNFCPIPDGLSRQEALPDCYSVASLDPQKRELAVKYTKNTIDTASRLQAKAVVLHSGRVEIADRTKELIALYNNGQKDAKDFLKLRDEIIFERKKYAEAFLKNALKSLEELNSYAQKKNILIGVETRYYFREIPILEEFSIILDSFKNSQVFYWHDSGHAELMKRLGFVKRHEDFLEAYADRMIGIHIHDILLCNDHKALGKGDFDFKRILPYVRKDTIKILEAHHPASPEEIKQSKMFLEGLFPDNA